MNGDEIIRLLGLTLDDTKVKELLSAFLIYKMPKLERGEMDAYVENTKLGVEFTFRDERYLDVKSIKYEEGSLVLWNVAFYGEDDNFNKFTEELLPLGLKFEYGRKEVEKQLSKKPEWEDQEMGDARWDFDNFCLFITFDEELNEILNIAVQLPVK